jgi:hypothetical protein
MTGSRRWNAMCCPSGDHAGAASQKTPGSIFTRPVPSGLIRKMSALPPLANAILVPSGDHAGVPS